MNSSERGLRGDAIPQWNATLINYRENAGGQPTAKREQVSPRLTFIFEKQYLAGEWQPVGESNPSFQVENLAS